MKKISKIIKALIVLWFIEVTVLSFVILYGLENGFRKWNWIVIISFVSIYVIFTIAIIIWENKGLKNVSKEMLKVDEFYIEQAKMVLEKIDLYFVRNPKIYNDMKLYWPYYKGLLKRIANGKKIRANTHELIEQIKVWQEENYEDGFLMNVYDVLLKNIV